MSDSPEVPEADETVTRASVSDDQTVLRDRETTSHRPKAIILRQPGGIPANLAPPSEDATLVRPRVDAEQDVTQLRGFDPASTTTPTKGWQVSQQANQQGKEQAGHIANVDDQTVIAGDSATTKIITHSDDSTVLKQAFNDATVIGRADDDSTIIGSGPQGKIDATYIASLDEDVKPKGNSEAGRLLKNRFVLEEKIGSGGMGDVYKALDLRQQEAQERNPYIAIKILNDNFSRHKDGFISLQREATRTRGIPHPNIMGVYDFDREGDTVFMSMELLDGQPLDDYLKDHREGVSIEDAWNIIDGISKGLGRAHDAGIVHSDFKPGNIYYTTDKAAKVFDFGIARAVTNPGELKADGEKTVFDAGSLGALTPTYASYEMLTGKEPTKSDDVYALALVTYELFTGKHPYDRTPADKALAQGLVPAPIPFLRRRHWRALKKALALKGEDRTQSIDEFSEGMFSVDPPYVRYGVLSLVFAGLLGFGVYSALYGGTVVPEEMTTLQGVFEVNMSAVNGRIEKPGAMSKDWQEQLSLGLARVRGSDQELEARFGSLLDGLYKGKDDRKAKKKADIEDLEKRTLELYLDAVGDLRDEASLILPRPVTATGGPELQVQINANIAEVQKALDTFGRAATYLSYASKHHNYNSDDISDLKGPLTKLIEGREKLQAGMHGDLELAIAREVAAAQAAEALAAAEQRRLQRYSFYEGYRADLTRILKCKGNLSDGDLDELGKLVGDMNAIYPEQFVLDKPGLALALAGCIEQRIAVRLPDRARQIRSIVSAYLPGEDPLESLEISDLDPCAARNLEGQGIRNRSWCVDKLAIGDLGPEMVVIPAKPGSEMGKFAISRTELQIRDYNLFCEQGGCDALPGVGNLPATSISFEQANLYVAWISDQSGKSYRMPGVEEWLHAATTNKSEAIDDNINCSVDSRGVRLGENLLNALSGRPNSWGLYNYVGNAREWVVDEEEGLQALGGAHTDPKAQCTLQSRVAHNGEPDPATGFRILRQISS